MHLTPQQVDAYRRDGCVFPVRVMSAQQAAHYRGCLQVHEEAAGLPLQGNI